MPPDFTGGVDSEDLWKVASHQFEDLKFADQKAIGLFGLANLLVAVISAVTGYLSGNLKGACEPLWIRAVPAATITFCIVCGAISSYFAMRAIRPRGKIGAAKLYKGTLEKLRKQNNIDMPLTHCVKIASFQRSIDYFSALRGLYGYEFDRELSSDIHRMAEIVFEKYRWISLAVFWALLEVISFALGIIAMLFTLFFLP